MRKIVLILLCLISNISFSQYDPEDQRSDKIINTENQEIDIGIKYVRHLAITNAKDDFYAVEVKKGLYGDDLWYGVINKTGNWIVLLSDDYKSITINEGHAVIERKNGTENMLYDLRNKKIINQATHISGFYEGINTSCENGKCKAIDLTGKTLFEYEATKIYKFSNGLARVKKGDDFVGYIDRTGKLVIPTNYYSIYDFESNGLAAIYPKEVDGDNDDKYTLIDKTGKIVLSTKYSVLRDFSDGLYSVEKAGKPFGYINSNGDKVLECKYESSDFIDGIARVSKKKGDNTLYGLINKKGEIIAKIEYESIEISKDNNFVYMRKPEQSGTFFDKNLKIYDYFKYGFINPDRNIFKCGLTAVKSNDYGDLEYLPPSNKGDVELNEISNYLNKIDNKKGELQEQINRKEYDEGISKTKLIIKDGLDCIDKMLKFKKTSAPKVTYWVKQLLKEIEKTQIVQAKLERI